jgi:hypothetical protein
MLCLNAALQRADLSGERRQVVDERPQGLPHQLGQPIRVSRLANDGEQRLQSVDAGRRDQTNLGEVRTQGIDQMRALTNEKIPAAMQH